MQYKAVITDLDGTAVDSPKDKVASRRLATAIAELDRLGIRVCAATGRAPSFAMSMLRSMNLKDPAIVSGGTKIIDPITGSELWTCGLSESQIRQITNKLEPFPYKYLWNDSTEEDYLSGGWELKKFNEWEGVYFFEVCFVPHDEVMNLVNALSDIDGIAVTVVVAQRTGTNDIHVTNSVATKEHAIYELEKMIGVEKNEMIGIGDGHNDLHLFNAVGYKVAMGNAVNELKQVADKVIGYVTDDGLAEYFEELAGGKI